MGTDASCLLYSLLFACSALTDAFGSVSIWLVLLVSAGPVTASLVQLDQLGRKTRGVICVIQQVLLFIVGLHSWPNCRSSTHLAVCAAFWLLAHKEVKLSHALSLQAAETAIAIGFRLSQVLPGQGTCSDIACTAACYLAIGLLAPAAVYHGSSSWEDPLGQATREVSCSSTKSSRAAVVHGKPGTMKQDAAGSADSPPSEDLLLLVCEQVATGALSPCLVQQQLELAAKRAQDAGSLPSSARCGSISSSRCPSTRPSTSFSSTSLSLDPSATFLVHNGVHSAAMHGSSDAALHHPSSEQPHHSQPHPHKVPAPSEALSFTQHHPWSVQLEASNNRTAATQTGPDLHVQLLGRHRPGRSRTAVNLLGPAEREELPPIVEAAHEGTQQQLSSPTQDPSRCPSLHFEHKTWPPTTPAYRQQGSSCVAASHDSGASRVFVEGGNEARCGPACHTPVEHHLQQASSATGGGSSSSSSSSKVAASATCRQGEPTDSQGGSCSMATEASMQELAQVSGGGGGRRSGGRGSQVQGGMPCQTGEVEEAEASARHGDCPSNATVPACLEPANALARKSPAPSLTEQQQQQQHSSASGNEAHTTNTAGVQEEAVEGRRTGSKEACNEAMTGTSLKAPDSAGAIGPAALQQHRRSSAQDSSDANTLVHPKSKHKKEGCNPASGNREATERSSTSSNVSGQAAAAAAVAAGAAKGQQASNASHRSSSSKGSSSPLQVGSLQRGGSPTPSEPEQREAAGEAREEPVREDLMGAWLDQQILLSNEAQSSESRVEADSRQATSREQAAPPHKLAGQQRDAQGSAPMGKQEGSPAPWATPAPTLDPDSVIKAPAPTIAHPVGGYPQSGDPPSKPQHSTPTLHPPSEPTQAATSKASRAVEPAALQAAAPLAQADPPVWVGSCKGPDNGSGKQPQAASDSKPPDALQPTCAPAQSLADPRISDGNSTVAGHNADQVQEELTLSLPPIQAVSSLEGAPSSKATSKASRAHRNNSFRFDHPRPAIAPSSSSLLPPSPPAQPRSVQASPASAHSAARALLGNSSHPSPALHPEPSRSTRSAQSSHQSSVEQPLRLRSSFDQDRDRGSPQSGTSASSRRVSFDLPPGNPPQKASSAPPNDHDNALNTEAGATSAQEPPSPSQHQQHQHRVIHPSLPALSEQQQQQLPGQSVGSSPLPTSSPLQHATAAAAAASINPHAPKQPTSPVQPQSLAEPKASTPSSPPGASGGIRGSGPEHQEQHPAASGMQGTPPEEAPPMASQPASQPNTNTQGHGSGAQQDPVSTDCPPCDPCATPSGTGDHGRDANFSNAPASPPMMQASPPMSPPQQQRDGSLARRFPAPKERSGLLKNVLPDSVRANLQSIPAKAIDQQQPTGYAGSTQIGSRKIRPTGESTELDVENTIIANRRYLDASKVLLDEIQVNKVLGFGSMGMVYFGVLWDTKVVVKMIEHGAGLLGKEQNRGKLARTEAVLSRMLLHPNVVITYDCCTGMMDATRLQVSGTPSRALRGKAGRQRQMTVMVQEFCDAGTLSDALQKRKHGLDMANPGYVELVMQLALDIANGIKYMHSLRVLHVDLKAENILLTHSNAGTAPAHNRPGHLTAKVADLGLALVLSMDSDEVQSGIHGTVSHMPPEAMRGTTFSMATDVYSFGVVLWELVTQGKPFAGLKAHQVVEAVCDFDERPPWPEQLHPKLVALKDLANQCWDASPCNRPSIFDVVDHLHEIIDPSLALKSSEGAGSVITDESDELELALKSQSKLPATTSQQLAHVHANEHADPLRPNKDAATEAAAHAQRPHTKRSSSGRRRSSIGSKRASISSGVGHLLGAESQKRVTGLQAIMAAGPPRDMLSRMLYYLAQVPPQREHLQQVEVGGGIVRFAAAVDMSGVRAR